MFISLLPAGHSLPGHSAHGPKRLSAGPGGCDSVPGALRLPSGSARAKIKTNETEKKNRNGEDHRYTIQEVSIALIKLGNESKVKNV